MNKNYHYLVSSFENLCWRYGLLYAGLLSMAISYGHSLLQATFWYWSICAPLFFIEYRGSYFLIKDGELMAWSFFMHGRDIPLQKIKSLKKGRSIVEIFQPVGINLVFEDVNGKLNDWTLSFSRLAAKEVIKFVDDLSAAAPDVVVDPELKIWIQKNGKDVPKK